MAKQEEPAVDLDFDLFDFAEVMPDDAHAVEEDIDLEKILSAFQEEEDNGELAAQAVAKEELDDELFSGAFKPAEGEEVEAPAAAMPAPKPAPARPAPDAAPKAQPSKTKAPKAQAPKAQAPKKVAQAAAQAAAEKVAAPSKAPPEPSAEAASAAPPAEAPARRRSLLSGSVLAAFFAMTLLNGLIAVVTLRSAHGLKGEMQSASAEMSEAALKLSAQAEEPALEPPLPREGPRTAPLTDDDGAAFERAEADIEEGRCAEARKRIYALLAVIDRTPEPRRAELEARGAFLLADSYRAQALRAEEPR